jgi:hypothetical protein
MAEEAGAMVEAVATVGGMGMVKVLVVVVIPKVKGTAIGRMTKSPWIGSAITGVDWVVSFGINQLGFPWELASTGFTTDELAVESRGKTLGDIPGFGHQGAHARRPVPSCRVGNLLRIRSGRLVTMVLRRTQQTRKPLFEPSSIDPNFLPKNADLLREPGFAQVYRSRMDPGHKVCREPVSTWVHLILWGIGHVA